MKLTCQNQNIVLIVVLRDLIQMILMRIWKKQFVNLEYPNDANLAYDNFSQTFIDVANKHAPLKQKKVFKQTSSFHE